MMNRMRSDIGLRIALGILFVVASGLTMFFVARGQASDRVQAALRKLPSRDGEDIGFLLDNQNISLEPVLDYLQDPYSSVAGRAQLALMLHLFEEQGRVRPVAISLASNGPVDVRVTALESLGRTKDVSVLPVLFSAFVDPHARVRKASDAGVYYCLVDKNKGVYAESVGKSGMPAYTCDSLPPPSSLVGGEEAKVAIWLSAVCMKADYVPVALNFARSDQGELQRIGISALECFDRPMAAREAKVLLKSADSSTKKLAHSILDAIEGGAARRAVQAGRGLW
jgi:hypothetical protein